MLQRCKKYIPAAWLNAYHYVLARLAAWAYGNPSHRLIVIGVTGTNGKTTTAYLLAKALEASGHATGCSTTAILKVADREWLNPTKMTTPGRFFLQRLLRDMLRAGCRYAVIETSSQGLIQHRHAGIEYDVAVFTNLTPEHIEAHGSFAAYQSAKRLLFEHVARRPDKRMDGRLLPRLAVVNADSPYAAYFSQVPGLTQTLTYGIDAASDVTARDVRLTQHGSTFTFGRRIISLHLPGRYNVENALAALAVCQGFGLELEKTVPLIEAVRGVPGRFERVEAGQPWTVIVDYAAEPAALGCVYAALDLVPHRRLIHVFGSCGGGRDIARRPVLGEMAGKKADIVIVTNEDPYDDDPLEIIRQVSAGAVSAGKEIGHDAFEILDRRQAIREAMRLAQPDDLVLMTGKGAEAWMCLADGKKIPWNEAEAAAQAIRERLASDKAAAG